MKHRHSSQKQQNKVNNSDLSTSVRESVHAMIAVHDRTPREVAQHHGITIAQAVTVAMQLAHDRAFRAGFSAGRASLWRAA
jgi:hypothetical protein